MENLNPENGMSGSFFVSVSLQPEHIYCILHHRGVTLFAILVKNKPGYQYLSLPPSLLYFYMDDLVVTNTRQKEFLFYPLRCLHCEVKKLF